MNFTVFLVCAQLLLFTFTNVTNSLPVLLDPVDPVPVPEETAAANTFQNGTRDGRGLLDTVQNVLQSAQTMKTLLGDSNFQKLVKTPLVQNFLKSQITTSSSSVSNDNDNNHHHYPHQLPNNFLHSQLAAQDQQQNFGHFGGISSSNLNNNFGVSPYYGYGSAAQVQGQRPYWDDIYQSQSYRPGTPANFYNNGFPPISNVQKQGSEGGGNSDLQSILSGLGLVEDGQDGSDFLSFANVERFLKQVNKFDTLQCIPKLVCQMVARRQQGEETEDADKIETSSTRTTSATKKRPSKLNTNNNTRKNSNSNSTRDGRLGLKMPKAMESALEQLVKLLDLMDLRDWSVYPYLKGAYEGNHVKTWDECADQFASCPFSQDQLLDYFNNYKGGIFQSFTSNLLPS